MERCLPPFWRFLESMTQTFGQLQSVKFVFPIVNDGLDSMSIVCGPFGKVVCITDGVITVVRVLGIQMCSRDYHLNNNFTQLIFQEQKQIEICNIVLTKQN